MCMRMAFFYRNFDVQAAIGDLIKSSTFEVVVLAKLINLRESLRDELDKTQEMVGDIDDNEEGADDHVENLYVYCDELIGLFVFVVGYIKNFEIRFEVDGSPEAILKRMWEEMV